MSRLPDFAGQEDRLFDFTRAELKRFAAAYRESFTYFAFDCNADYGEVLLCLDTTANSLAEAKRNCVSIANRRRERHAPPYGDIPMYDLEWMVHRLGNDLEGFVLPFGNNTGDFSHQGFAEIEFDDWEEFRFQEPTQCRESNESRINCYAAVLLSKVIDRLVDADAFAPLHKSRPFYCGIGLHDGVQRVLRIIE